MNVKRIDSSDANVSKYVFDFDNKAGATPLAKHTPVFWPNDEEFNNLWLEHVNVDDL